MTFASVAMVLEMIWEGSQNLRGMNWQVFWSAV
jgi:hypothetical protein